MRGRSRHILDRALRRGNGSDEGKISVFQHRTGRWLEIRRPRFQAHRLPLVRRVERKQDEAETVYPGAPHGLTETHKDPLNADLLAFFKASA